MSQPLVRAVVFPGILFALVTFRTCECQETKEHRSQADDRTPAERIAGVKRLIASDSRRLDEMGQTAAALNARFETLSEEFTALDRIHSSSKRAEIESRWKTSRDELDQLIHRRILIQAQSKTLSEKLMVENDYLRQLTQPFLSPLQVPPLVGDRPVEPVLPSPSAPSTPSISGGPAQSLMPVGLSGGAVSAAPTGQTANTAPLAAKASTSLSETDERIVAARKDQEAKREKLKATRDKLKFIDRSIDVFEADLKQAREMLALVQQQAQSQQASSSSNLSLREADALQAIKAAETEKQSEEAKAALKREGAVIAETEAVLKRLHSNREELSKQVAENERALSNSQTWSLLLESPLSPSQQVNWLTVHGPKIFTVVVILLILLGIARLVERRVLMRLLQNLSASGGSNGRAETLRRVFHSFTNFAMLTLGSLAILDQAGVNVTVLLGGAAVLGAAIAFGSQNLIRDFFSGFMILVENQYSVGHVVSINNKSGLVEDISLRITVLRDEEGTVHFIPHSEAKVVSNMTHGWARAVFEVMVDYREDVDKVSSVLMQLARELRNDPQFGLLIIDFPELQGVDRLGDSAVVIKFLIKTQPIQQWNVKREMLRRIKKKFDELGIAFAFPQRELHIHDERTESRDRSSTSLS